MSSFEGVKLAVWDLDGTIIDSYGVFAAVLTEAAELSGKQMPDEQTIRHNFHGSLDESIKGVLDMVDGEDFVVLLNDFLRIQEGYYQHPEEHIFADAKALAEHLGSLGVRQVVATNREHAGRGTASPRYLIENSSLKPLFETIIPGEEAPARKPDAAVISAIADREQLQPHQVIVIGDQVVDAQLAQNLSAKAIIVNRNPDPVPHLELLGDDTAFMAVVSSLDEVR